MKDKNIKKLTDWVSIVFYCLSVIGVFISLIGLFIFVKSNYALLFDFTKSTGTIIRYDTKPISKEESSLKKFPVVSFANVNGEITEFVSNFGHKTEVKEKFVPIIFSSKNPKNAIIDLGYFKNWLEIYIWLFVLIISVLGVKRFAVVLKKKTVDKN